MMNKKQKHGNKLICSNNYLNFIRKNRQMIYEEPLIQRISVSEVCDKKNNQIKSYKPIEKIFVSPTLVGIEKDVQKLHTIQEYSIQNQLIKAIQQKNNQIAEIMEKQKEDFSSIVYRIEKNNKKSMQQVRNKNKIVLYDKKFPKINIQKKKIILQNTIKYEYEQQQERKKKQQSLIFIKNKSQQISSHEIDYTHKKINNMLIEKRKDYLLRSYYQFQNSLHLKKNLQSILPMNIIQKPTFYQQRINQNKRYNKIIKIDEQQKSHNFINSNNEQKKLFEKLDPIKLEIVTTPIKNNCKNILKQKIKPKKIIESYQDDKSFTVYQNKILKWRRFLFQMNFAHRVFDPLILQQACNFKLQNRYKFYIGNGNNSILIKSLIKRRFWWQIEDDKNKANFVWTQLKYNNYYQKQSKVQRNNNNKIDDKIQDNNNKNIQYIFRKNNKNQQILHKKSIIFSVQQFAQDLQKIFTNIDINLYLELQTKYDFTGYVNYQFYRKILTTNLLNQISNISNKNKYMHNHLPFNYHLGNKKAMFYNLQQYYNLINEDVFKIIPKTYHIKNGQKDDQYKKWVQQYRNIDKNKKKKCRNIWIVKPGQLSNRGNGITVIDEIYEFQHILKSQQKHHNGENKTYIIQKYIQQPFLYKRRKFDIRHYLLITHLYGRMRAYWYKQGYIRTSSYQYDINQITQPLIHLTNDSIQQNSQIYGKYEQGNKLSYGLFQRYLDMYFSDRNYDFSKRIYPKMKEIALNAVKSTFLSMDPERNEHNFEIFGLDFMIDCNFKPWLIQCNTNPCLQLSNKHLERIIPAMLQNTFRLTLDVIFPPTYHYSNMQKHLVINNPLQNLQYQLIFDQDRDGKIVRQLYRNIKNIDIGNIDQDNEIYENEGQEINIDQILQ